MNDKANLKKGEQCDVKLNPKPYLKAGDKRSRHVGSLSSVSETYTSLNDETQEEQSKKKLIDLNNVLTEDSTELKTMIKDIVG
ncbi:hypothetical protein DPMN_148115 [Dreissena polymorpha]|uniref:Uncharacterized protein n=1 Tax=Dreissena polymorpha TaxID=45954 RepID=A0A9D4FBV6_DREPO|nr:hypothetical protein DPMN_148115 [Dreissena polymorpha]